MSNTFQFANNANTTLAAPINTLATSCTVSAGTGTLFPTPATNQPFLMTFTDAATGTITEIVLVTARTGDVMTITRAQEGTTAKSWLAGDSAANLVTAQTLQNVQQIPQAQASAANWAQDTGTINSYVGAYSPPITQHIDGMTLRIKIANANSGASTLDVGAGPAQFLNPDGSQLGSGALIAGGFAEFVDDGTHYQLISSSQQAQSLAGAATTGAFQWRPTSETLSGWVVANATTIGNASSNATQRANADTSSLFAWHWNNFSNTQCPVFTSGGVLTTRGANAAADFAANKQIQVYDKRGRGVIGVDTMGGSTTARLAGVPVTSGGPTTPGSVLGENTHPLIIGEIPPISSSGTVNIAVSGFITVAGPVGHSMIIDATNTIINNGGGGGFAAWINGSGAAAGSVSFIGAGQTMAGNNPIGLNSTGTNGTAHNTVESSDAGYWWIKL